MSWMLGVLATLCVVAIAARRGQLWFHEPRVVCAKDMMSTAMPAPAPPTVTAPTDRTPAAIRKYLLAHFAGSGLAYVGAPLVEVRNDRLQRVLPRTRFFKSTLVIGDRQGPRIDVLVSYKPISDNGLIVAERDDIQEMFFRFGMPSSNFIGQFVRLAPTPRDREELALGIVELLATITYEGSARPLPNHGRNARAQLRYDGRPYLDIEIHPRPGRVAISVIPRYPRDLFSVAGYSTFGAP